MTGVEAAWETRMSALWTTIDDHEAQRFLALVDELVAELPATSAIGRFERAAALDSTGHPERAVPLYTAALEAGLTGERRRRATIQLASSLRNLGRAREAVGLLTAEMHAAHDELDGAVRGFLALALTDVGREREAVAIALTALAGYLPRYNGSMARYADSLVEDVP